MNSITIENQAGIQFIWQYSKFYGNNLYECIDLYNHDKGYLALVLFFETLENICKSIIENYDISFFDVIKELKEMNLINKQEEYFLSTHNSSVRRVRNLFAHANLSTLGFWEKGIYYPLEEESSCLLLFKKMFVPSLNIMIKLVREQ